MPASMATKLGIQFARFAQYTAASAATNNAGSHGIRGAFANASSGPAPAFAPGLSSGGSASANATGIGGAKFQAGKGAHSAFQNSGRTLANANASSANDGITSISDEDDDVAQLSAHGPAKIHRPFFQERRESIFQHGLRSRLIETTSTLHLILPSSPGRHASGARSISSSASQESAASNSSVGISHTGKDDSASRQRSLSTSASQSQEVAGTEAGSTSSTPPEAILRARVQPNSSPQARYGNETAEGEAAVALQKMIEARQSRTPHLMQLSVDIYRQSPADHFSAAGFNLAMHNVLDVKDEDSTAKVFDLYEQMIDANHAPTRKTYAHLIRALCERDYEDHKIGTVDDLPATSTFSDANFKQALAFVELVHSSSMRGFDSVHPYNQVLRSCAIRGDAERACAIIDKLSSNKFVNPTALTFTELLDALRRSPILGSSPEAIQEEKARKMQSCEHVFEEFEVFRASSGWKQDETTEVSVWNVMISMYIQTGSPDKAIELIQRMMEGESLSDGKVTPPRPTDVTARVIIRDLMAAGDTEGALKWLEQIITLNSGVEEGQRTVMPLPNVVMIYALFKEVLRLIPVGEAEDVMPHMPAVIKANRILDIIYAKMRSNPGYGLEAIQRVDVTNGDWRSMMLINVDYGIKLIKQGRLEEASTLSDLSLSHIQQQFDIYANELSFIALREKYELVNVQHMINIRESVVALLQVIQLLLLQDRFHDAAACFSYAVAAWPPEHWRSAIVPLPFSKIEEASSAIMGFRRKSNIAVDDAEMTFAQAWEIKPEIDLQLHTHIALTYILPAVQHRMPLPISYKTAAKELYLTSRQQLQAAELNIDVRGWGYLIDAVISEGIEKGIDVGSLDLLVKDLAALSEEERDQLSLQTMIAHLPELIGQQKALEYLQRIRPALKAEEVTATQKADSSIGSVTDNQGQQTATELASPTTTATSLGSPETASEYNTSLPYTLPPIITIDADLGYALVQEGRQSNKRFVKGARNNKGAKGQQVNARLQPLYMRLTDSIQQEGVYPSPDGICELMNQFGRVGALEKVKELYLTGRHVVAGLGGDPDWQMQAWYELEDTMTAALAHGGDHRLANAHRITLLQAGQAPKADTYAALITVIRDTTDDVMVAEELFDESQRLGVTPTLYLFNTVLSKLSRARKAERAMQLFDEMRNRGVQPSSITYGAILNACTRTGDEVNAERFFAMMEGDAQFKPQAPPYNTMLQFYTSTKPDRQKALFYYEKACKRNVEPTSHTYKLLLDVYGAIAPYDEEALRNVFGQLIADGRVDVQGNHWAAVIWAYGSRLLNLDKAIEIYHSIPTHVSTIRAGKGGQEPDALAFEALLGVLAEHKRMDLIEEQLKQREEKGCDLTAYVANVVIKAYASLIPDVGLERARQVFEMMQDPPMGMAAAGNHPLQRQHVSGVQHEASFPVDAANGAQLAGFERLKREPSTFEAMIRAEMEHGNLEQATALIYRMQSRGYPPIVVAHAQDILVQQPAASSES